MANDEPGVSPEGVAEVSVVEDVRRLLSDDYHPIYKSAGTKSSLTPDSVFHVAQLQVLFEDQYFHWRTQRAIQSLRTEGFLSSESRPYGSGGNVQLLWRHNMRYVTRKAKQHVELLEVYSSDITSKACGEYAETLTLLGMSRLGARLVDRNAREYRSVKWTQTEHDLDFIFEFDGRSYGVEVKNTFPYMPDDEFRTKLDICAHLGLRPLFVLRSRHSRQWEAMRTAGGLAFLFKTKIFPPGQEQLAKQIWEEMRLPVAVWNDWRGPFYKVVDDFLRKAE